MKLFSIKLRASLEGKHVSGAERIVPEEKIEQTLSNLYNRVASKEHDDINIKIQSVKEKPLIVEKTLPIEELQFDDYIEANQKAIRLLKEVTGLSEKKLKQLITLIHSGAAPDGSNMRGAMIVNLEGERIEKDSFRGVRTTDVDFMDREKVVQKLLQKGWTERTADALALATKNMLHPDIVAEYCISDEPDYLTGYVATKEKYYRFTPLKEKGNTKGGRIYFVKNQVDIDSLYKFLQETPVLIKDVK
ncbi:6-carboxyhexanoate--CoA ligase [Persephonella sp.]|uniref:6-carboxyhexanoate--CoA ligase n=1 Tax=Persephonella sp. TaxID=2060922 RepID=UPI0026180C4B|nr:6-carboxyhexanoate--CoA ligase [Persephonella sp.]